jgi:hypothetical protein
MFAIKLYVVVVVVLGAILATIFYLSDKLIILHDNAKIN